MLVIETAGARIHYTRAGAGPPVIFVQGVGVIGRGWTPQAEALCAGYSVITIDNRGIGASTIGSGPLTIEAMAADVLSVADAEAIDHFHLAGHSMGGVIAQEVALTRARVCSASRCSAPAFAGARAQRSRRRCSRRRGGHDWARGECAGTRSSKW